ncbi:MAG: DUF2723 domain-containing protein [Chloroflexi bacterium]|nr:DUF2723 domain-containing protein [Chloroflexota bacterium]
MSGTDWALDRVQEGWRKGWSTGWPAAVGMAGVALWLYCGSLAPDLTWAHQGADGGELLAAAATNGVPHPPGYPLYMLLLQGWLALLEGVAPSTSLVWRGNLLSACFGAASVLVSVRVADHLLAGQPLRWAWAGLAGGAWAVTPLLWSQSILTEVYSLHALLIALLGWAVLVKPQRLWYSLLPVALGTAHHLTLLLLLPAAGYRLMVERAGPRRWRAPLQVLLGGILIGALWYVRVPLAAATVSPVNWGYADNWEGFVWLVSGAAYRGYLVLGPADLLWQRLTLWAYTVTLQFTPVGLALGFVGLASWDRWQPSLRTFSLLWGIPVSLYALFYHTRDSELYLLPLVWLSSLWLAVGAASVASWLAARWGPRCWPACALFLALLLAGGTAGRWPAISLADDQQARRYLAEVAAVLEPDSLVVTLGDQETFAIWYGLWGDRTLEEAAPGTIAVNESLYQFDWYRRLQRALHPQLAGLDLSAAQAVERYGEIRPVFFAYRPAWLDATQLEETGPLWRFKQGREVP